jgi:hypothetical protein
LIGENLVSTLAQAVQNQIDNIQKKTGKTFADIAIIVKGSGLSKHGEIRDLIMSEFGLGYGDANALAHAIFQSDGTRAAQANGLSTENVFDEMYHGPKAALRPIHDAVMDGINTFGEFEILPKKGYVSLRRKKQFAMLGPATNTRVELGLNIKDLDADADPRLIAQPKGSMCNFIVRVTDVGQVDVALINWLRLAFDAAG